MEHFSRQRTETREITKKNHFSPELKIWILPTVCHAFLRAECRLFSRHLLTVPENHHSNKRKLDARGQVSLVKINSSYSPLGIRPCSLTWKGWIIETMKFRVFFPAIVSTSQSKFPASVWIEKRSEKFVIDLSKRKEIVFSLLGRAKQSFVSKSLVQQCLVKFLLLCKTKLLQTIMLFLDRVRSSFLENGEVARAYVCKILRQRELDLARSNGLSFLVKLFEIAEFRIAVSRWLKGESEGNATVLSLK